ncbi:MAG: PqqD family protein [Eubacterium sp.]|nr:PqqD family protein [Eubacterium sp.]
MKIKDGFVKCKVGEDYLVVTTGNLSKENNIMIELNETSSDIWDCIVKGMDVEQIANKLSEKYEIPFDKAKADTEKLIENMKNAGIFE